MSFLPDHQLARLFKQQVQYLKQYFAIQILAQDESALDIRYQVPVSLANTSTFGRLSPQIPSAVPLTFRVLLPQQFPFRPPTVFLLQRIDLSKCPNNQHPLLDENQALSDPSLSFEGWSSMNPTQNPNFNFGLLLKAALDKFAQYPQFLSFLGPNMNVPNLPATYTIEKYQKKVAPSAAPVFPQKPQNPVQNFPSAGNSPAVSPISNPSSSPKLSQPGEDIKESPQMKEALEELKKFQSNAEEKVSLYENEDLLVGFLENLKTMKERREMARSLGKDINNLGEQNMKLSEECSKKMQVLKEKNANFVALTEELEKKRIERANIMKELTDKDKIAKRLKASMQEKDAECNNIVKKWFSQAQQSNNSLNVESFIEEYKKERISYHLKKQKHDLLLK